MRAVLDTNVLVSGLLSPNGRPARLLYQIGSNDFILYCDERIFEEYTEVLHRDKFGFNRELVDFLLASIRQYAIFVNPTPLDADFSNDESDKKFYEVAKFCNATLITGNLKHYPSDPLIKSVREI